MPAAGCPETCWPGPRVSVTGWLVPGDCFFPLTVSTTPAGLPRRRLTSWVSFQVWVEPAETTPL